MPRPERRGRRFGPVWYVLFAGTAVGLLLAVWAFWIEPDRLIVERVEIPLAGWPADRPPLRIVLASDLHVGAPHIDLDKLDAVVAQINALHPDIVLLLGDFVIGGVLGGEYTTPVTIAERLKALRARHGVFAVLGNHDWWRDGPGTMGAFRRAGIRVLENQAFPIRLPEGRFWIAGLADELTRLPDPGSAIAGIPRGEPIVAMMHSPVTFPRVPPRVTVSFAAHSHGGQVALPFIGPLILPDRVPSRFARGLIREDGKTLFVTSGIGTSIIPVRFGVPPEIVLATIRSAR